MNKHSFDVPDVIIYTYGHPTTTPTQATTIQTRHRPVDSFINFSSVNTNNIKTSSNLGWLYEPLGRAEQADDEKKGPPKRDWHKGRSYTQFWGSHL